jgi:RNA polymerase sigma-70 factor (ECF subfamily)
MARPSAPTSDRTSEFAAMVRAHQAGLWRYLRFLGCDGALAEDLVQDTFVAVWHKPFEDRGARATTAYLRRVAKNNFLMAVRRRRARPAFQELREADRAWDACAGDDDGAAYRTALAECVEQLQPRQRQGVELCYGQQQSRDGIAAQLGMTADGVKTLLRRAREALRVCVEGRVRG